MKRNTFAIALLFLSILVGCANRHGPYRLVTNNSLEQLGPKGLPVGYTTFKAWGAVPKFSSDETEHRSGKRSFRISSTQPTQAWIRTAQFQVAPGEALHAIGWVKMQDIAGDKEG